MVEMQLRRYGRSVNSKQFLWIAGMALGAVLAGCGGETAAAENPETGDAPSVDVAVGSTGVVEDTSSASLGFIEVEVNGDPRRFEIRPGSDTSLVPVVQALRIEGRGEEGDSLSVFAKPVDLDSLQLPATLENQTAADLKPGQLPNSLGSVILQYTDHEGTEYSSGPSQAITIEDWSDKTLVSAFSGADLAARQSGSVRISAGRVMVTFPR